MATNSRQAYTDYSGMRYQSPCSSFPFAIDSTRLLASPGCRGLRFRDTGSVTELPMMSAFPSLIGCTCPFIDVRSCCAFRPAERNTWWSSGFLEFARLLRSWTRGFCERRDAISKSDMRQYWSAQAVGSPLRFLLAIFRSLPHVQSH